MTADIRWSAFYVLQLYIDCIYYLTPSAAGLLELLPGKYVKQSTNCWATKKSSSSSPQPSSILSSAHFCPRLASHTRNCHPLPLHGEVAPKLVAHQNFLLEAILQNLSTEKSKYWLRERYTFFQINHSVIKRRIASHHSHFLSRFTGKEFPKIPLCHSLFPVCQGLAELP